MKISVTSNIDVKKILNSRGLGADKKAVKFLASEVKRYCDDYVPMQQGVLKNTAAVVEYGNDVVIEYNQPYAHYQYTGLVMAGTAPKHYTGQAISYHGAPKRGAKWDKRMMNDRGSDVAASLAKYVGGTVK